MTFEQFKAECQKKQRQYIREEVRRFKKAEKLWFKYSVAMGALGIHPLNLEEIRGRQRTLEKMTAQVPVHYGDTFTMRHAYAMHHSTQATQPIG